MLGGTRAYEKVGQEEEGEALSPSFSEPSQPRRPQRRPWARFLEVFSKAAICILAAYGFYAAVQTTIALSKPSEHHHNHHHVVHEKAHDESVHNTPHEVVHDSAQKPILHDDGYVTYPDHKSCSCGASVEEAMAMGCKYDSHALAWLPVHCRDDELTEEFEHLGPGPDGRWELYSDPDGQHPLNMTEISMVPGTKFYMTLEWHNMVSSMSWSLLASLFRSWRYSD
jgi:hypothetical protein